MGSDRRGHVLTFTAGLCVVAFVLLVGAGAALAAAAWWSPVALDGTAVTRVSALGDTILVRTGSGATLESSDGGRSFAAAPSGAMFPATAAVTVGTQRWAIDAGGRIVHVADIARTTAALRDPGSPDLGRGADLIAAPAALPGVVVAVSTNGTVWRRGQDGDWKQALLLLPASLVQGIPRITSVTAFAEPLSATIYLGTDGYGVLISTDGGDDWIRAGPGLPDSVTSLAADSTRHALYAGTPDGLWEHVLQELPAPPAYRDAALVWRWLGIGAVVLLASGAALFALIRVGPRRAAA